MNFTNTRVPGVTFEETKINLPIELELIVLVLAYVVVVGVMAILLFNIV